MSINHKVNCKLVIYLCVTCVVLHNVLPPTYRSLHIIQVFKFLSFNIDLCIRLRSNCSHQQQFNNNAGYFLEFFKLKQPRLRIEGLTFQLLLYNQMPSYINSQQIFPKRLGIMNGSTLVLEYYNLAKDKFKKHLMPFDSSTETKHIVEQIFKNPKHIPFLKKVNPKHITSVLEGQKIGFRQHQSPPSNNFEEFYQPKREQIFKQKKVVEEAQEFHHKVIQKHQPTEVKQKINPVVKQSFYQQQQQAPKPQEPEQYYNQEFEEFQISASMDKKSNKSSNFSKLEPSIQEKSSLSKSEVSSIQPVKQKKKEKKQIVQEVIQEYDDDFEFIDQDQAKKDKKEKKQKKGKSKSKSKDKKSKKQKEAMNQAKKDSGKIISESKEVQEEFQFL